MRQHPGEVVSLSAELDVGRIHLDLFRPGLSQKRDAVLALTLIDLPQAQGDVELEADGGMGRDLHERVKTKVAQVSDEQREGRRRELPMMCVGVLLLFQRPCEQKSGVVRGAVLECDRSELAARPGYAPIGST